MDNFLNLWNIFGEKTLIVRQDSGIPQSQLSDFVTQNQDALINIGTPQRQIPMPLPRVVRQFGG